MLLPLLAFRDHTPGFMEIYGL